MKNMTLRNIAGCCGGTYFGDEASLDAAVTSVAIDSRNARAGYLSRFGENAQTGTTLFLPL